MVAELSGRDINLALLLYFHQHNKKFMDWA